MAAPGIGVLGALIVAAAAPGAFDDARWEPLLTTLASALLQHLRNKQVGAGRGGRGAGVCLLSPPCRQG
jgi:hypothetical protein